MHVLWQSDNYIIIIIYVIPRMRANEIVTQFPGEEINCFPEPAIRLMNNRTHVATMTGIVNGILDTSTILDP